MLCLQVTLLYRGLSLCCKVLNKISFYCYCVALVSFDTSVWDDEKVLEIGSGDGCTAM